MGDHSAEQRPPGGDLVDMKRIMIAGDKGEILIVLYAKRAGVQRLSHVKVKRNVSSVCSQIEFASFMPKHDGKVQRHFLLKRFFQRQSWVRRNTVLFP